VPRAFVTGESLAGAHSYLVESLAPGVLNASFASVEELVQGVVGEDMSAPRFPAARCALEMALFDAAGRSWGKSVSEMLGGAVQESVRYSAVLPLVSPRQLPRFFQLVKEKRMQFVKLKVGEAHDLEILDLARKELGWLIDIRVDANGAWTAEEALIRLKEMLPYGISAVEQPVAKEDYAGLHRVSQALEIPVIADESLCTEADAQRLIDLKACRMFNIRLSKCGGLNAARRIRDLAQEAGIACQLGCHVGETSILAAAGRHFALCSRNLAYVKGSFAPYLLAADPVEQPVVFQDEGIGPPLPGVGLGVTVREDILMELAASHVRLS
jgi:L-Ala-D/L-Glu epimerase